ncbi:hypothetical protein EV644_119112 [Kribbella orskensis]|uniref:ParB-like nuclease family protein n=1 Tax=Kribbella orskensis TaxID=2512216 RepID=A0ABY2BBL2_9ACTN|nr:MULTISPECIES: hypothetical protein [Kribbella]TCN34570.1 hypothetical protein EV642_12031 [Kribbella sp. VKM Ac-2500]TCO14999.1 hypothetical protein EV644_119112 [Kribbella orskensis]
MTIDGLGEPELSGADRTAPEVSFEELLAMTPDSMRDVFPPTRWQLGKLWALDLRVEPVEVADLLWMFDLPLWQLNGERFRVTPNQVAATPMNFRPHYQRVMDADLDFPIHLVAYRGRLVVLDGVHRLLKAHFLRRRWIEAKIATATQLQGCTA